MLAFNELLGSAALRSHWFTQMLQLSFVGGLTGEYVDFSTAQHAALLMLAERHGRSIMADHAIEIVDRMSSLPSHPEVPGALRTLRETSLKTVALTNSIAAVAEAHAPPGQVDRTTDPRHPNLRASRRTCARHSPAPCSQ